MSEQVREAYVGVLASHQRRATDGGPCWCGEWPRRDAHGVIAVGQTWMEHVADALLAAAAPTPDEVGLSAEVWWDRGRKQGQPCVSGTRIPTAIVAGLGPDGESAAEMWDLTPEQVEGARAAGSRHGDRCIAACDGGWDGRRASRAGAGPMCDYAGWEQAEEPA